MSDDAAIGDILRKIEREKALITAANNMRQATQNAAVSSRLESNVRDARRNIQYFEQTLQDLQSRKMGDGMNNLSLSGNGGPPPPSHSRGLSASAIPQQTPTQYEDPGSYGNPGPGGYSMGGGNGLMPPRAPYAPPPPGPQSTTPRNRPNYSRLGMSLCLLKLLIICSRVYRSHQSRHSSPWTPHSAHAFATGIQAQCREAVQRWH